MHLVEEEGPWESQGAGQQVKPNPEKHCHNRYEKRSSTRQPERGDWDDCATVKPLSAKASWLGTAPILAAWVLGCLSA